MLLADTMAELTVQVYLGNVDALECAHLISLSVYLHVT